MIFRLVKNDKLKKKSMYIFPQKLVVEVLKYY